MKDLLVKLFAHFIGDVLRSNTVDLEGFLRFGVEYEQPSVLATSISEQDQEMIGITFRHLLQQTNKKKKKCIYTFY